MKKHLILSLFLLFCFSRSFSAVVENIKVYSKSMDKQIGVMVISPDISLGNDQAVCPSLYLLHGYGSNGRNWLKFVKPNLGKLADQYGMYIICPDALNSCYWDSPIDSSYRYETFITKELLPFVDKKYKTDHRKEQRAVTGLSMGGQGAFYLAIKHKSLFGAVGSMSGGVDIRPFAENWEMKDLLGSYSKNKKVWEEHTIYCLADNLKDGELAILFDCGVDDFFYKVNNALHEKFLRRGIKHDYIVRPGRHNRAYWKNSMDYQLLFFSQFFQRSNPRELPFSTKKIRIACIGNSITYGSTIMNRAKNSYPKQLQYMLGEGYDVRNFGCSGATLLTKGDHPYVKTSQYKASKAFQPDVVTIKLGTNDSKPWNIKYINQFKTDYRQLIQSYKNLSSHPRVILLLPIRCYLTDPKSINNQGIQERLVPLIKEIAREEQVEVWNLYPIFGETYRWELLPDKLHPSSLGATEVASFLYKKFAIHPIMRSLCSMPGSEFRSGAGWKKGAEWHAVAEEISTILSKKKVDVLFLGNSITQGFGGSRQLVTYKPGLAITNEILNKYRWETAGISGDRTQHLLWRVLNGKYNNAKPSYVVVSIGVNNIIAGDQPLDIAKGIKEVALASKKEFPQAKILLLGLLPTGQNLESINRQKYNQIQKWLSLQDWKGIQYIDPTSWFVDEQGMVRKNLYGGDYIHLKGEGYRVWCRHLLNYLN